MSPPSLSTSVSHLVAAPFPRTSNLTQLWSSVAHSLCTLWKHWGANQTGVGLLLFRLWHGNASTEGG